MNQIMACMVAHPPLGEEVVAVDEVDVGAGHVSIDNTSEVKERMSRR